MALPDLLQQLDPRNTVRKGRQFETLCKWYLNNAPEYRGQFRQVWLWGDWPDRWGQDAGIDLIAETHDGDLWAIQAKAYDERYTVTKADVNSFLTESARPMIAQRLLIATTDHLSRAGHRLRVESAGTPPLRGQSRQSKNFARHRLPARGAAVGRCRAR